MIRLISPRTLIYVVAVVVLLMGSLVGSGYLAKAQSGGTWASCTLYWFGWQVGPPECGSPPPGSECSPSCSNNLPGFCPTDYCWSVWIPDPAPTCPSEGQPCTSAANSCGMTGSGTIDSNCSCTAAVPSDALCPAPTCSNGSAGPYPACPLPSCADYGQLGTYPDCYAAPQPSCADSGQIGTYPDCYAPPGGDPAPTASLTANPTSIASGGSSTLSWSSSNATSCVGGGFSTGGATSGTRSVSPASTATYTVQCTGPGGASTDDATVTVSGGNNGGGGNGGGSCSNTGPVSIEAEPSRVQPGGSTVLSWTGSNIGAASCVITNVNTGAQIDSAAVSSCRVGNEATAVSGISAQTTFRMSCGSLVDEVIVNIVPRYEEF